MTRLFAGTQFDRPPRCEVCEQLEEDCTCPPPAEPEPVRIPPEQQTTVIRVEKRRKGKAVTVIRGLSPEGNDLSELLTHLKTRCGAGGTLQDDALEIQGRRTDQVAVLLRQLGYKVKTN